jgi:hypothetical protein
MLRYWDDSPHTKGKKKQKMVKCCYFIWNQDLILKPLVFWLKFGSDQGLCLATINSTCKNKSPVTQEEMEYVLCWRQSPIVLFPLEEKKKQNKTQTPSNWDLVFSLPPIAHCSFSSGARAPASPPPPSRPSTSASLPLPSLTETPPYCDFKAS